MLFLSAILVYLVISLVGPSHCDNFTRKYVHNGLNDKVFKTKQHKLITFNTESTDKIEIELDFSVPFITIPVNKQETNGSSSLSGTLANLNVGAVLLAGLMAFGAAFVVPATYHLFNTKNHQNKYRSEDSPEFGVWRLMNLADKVLKDNNIDSTSCAQRALCWMVLTSNSELEKGTASSTAKIVDGLATNSLVRHFLQGTVFGAAVDSALNGINCSEEYKQCTIDQTKIEYLGKHLITALYN